MRAYTKAVISLVFSSLLLGLVWTSQVHAAPLSIINGADVVGNEHTNVVGILQATVADDYLAQFCGGTLIDSQWVLTAAHCTFDEEQNAFQPENLNVIVGRRVLGSRDGARLLVDQIIRHAEFNPVTYTNDIALLHLATPTTVTPVQLATVDAQATTSSPVSTVQATIVGWGVTGEGVGATILQQAEVPLVATDKCRAFYAQYAIVIDATMICAGYEQGRVDACTGDSGGPLLVWNSDQNQWIQVGIISWGASCAEAGVYGVYTDVASFTAWLEVVTHPTTS